MGTKLISIYIFQFFFENYPTFMCHYNGDKTFIKSIYSKKKFKIIANQVKLSGTTNNRYETLTISNKLATGQLSLFSKLLYYLRKLKIMRNVTE